MTENDGNGNGRAEEAEVVERPGEAERVQTSPDLSAEERAQAMVQAQSASDESLELEFANRVEPVVNELKARCQELAEMGDEAGVAHTRFALDTLIQRFRLPSAEHLSENAGFFGQGYVPEETPQEDASPAVETEPEQEVAGPGADQAQYEPTVYNGNAEVDEQGEPIQEPRDRSAQEEER